jgi:nucleotide-binding universal stress UspA family protein
MEVTEREGGERAQQTRQMFDEYCRENSLTVAEAPGNAPGATISWREEAGREDEVIAVRGRLFDVVVVGRAVKNAALPSPITLEAALLDTGRPIVVAPPNSPSDVGRSVAVAWESSPEAARAISFAIPLLAAADTVTLLSPKPVEPPSIQASELTGRLAWSGINALVRNFDIRTVEIGAGFLSAASEVGADLLVKGAYSRSRLRQMVLGGRTRHIITHTEIPVLLSH